MDLDLNSLMKSVSKTRANLEARSGKNRPQKPPQGKSIWRILPGWRVEERGTFYHPFAEHWIKEPNPAGGDPLIKGVVVCERETFDRECECCDRIAQVAQALRSAGHSKESPQVKQLGEMRAGVTYLLNAIRIDGTGASMTPVLLQLGTKAFTQYVTLLENRGSEGINILNLKGGKNIIINRTGSGQNDTEYTVTDAGNTSDIDESVLANLVNIDAWIEAQRAQGVSKTYMIGDATRKVLGLTGPAPSVSLMPPAAALVAPAHVAPSRMIEVDEPSVHATSTPTPAPAPASAPVAAPAPAPASTAPVAAAGPASNDLLNDDELSALLDQL